MNKLCIVALLCGIACAQQDPETIDGLIGKQARLARQIAELDARMRAVADAIEAEQPAEAARIREAWQLMQQLLIERDMQSTQELLAGGSNFEAKQLAGQLVEHLALLLAALQEPEPEVSPRDRLRDLLALRARLQALSDAQRDQLVGSEAGEGQDPDGRSRRQGELAADTETTAGDLSEGAEPGSGRAQAGDAARAASLRMRDAQRQLGEDAPEEARDAQQDALDELDDAIDAIDLEIAEYRDRERQHTLFNLRAALDALVAGQAGIGQRTEALETQRVEADGSQRFLRRYLMKSSGLAIEQAELAENLEAVRTKLAEEGARVFSFVAENARIDMQRVSERLLAEDAALRTDACTRNSQQRILADLQGLRQALDRALREASAPSDAGPGGPGGDGPDQGPPPLVSHLEELRLIQHLQHATREQTAELERAVRQVEVMSPLQEALLERLAAKQGNLVDLLADLLESLRNERAGVE